MKKLYSISVIIFFFLFGAKAQTIHEVSVSNFIFTPQNIEISPGDVVRWTNLEGFHSINGSAESFPENSVSFGNDPSDDPWVYDFTFNTVGDYFYNCAIHPFTMLGSISCVEQLDIQPNPISAAGNSSQFEIVANATITNNSSFLKSYTWERNIIEISPSWETAVIDVNLAYFPFVNSASFTLNAGQSANLDVVAYPNGVDGSAIVELSVVDDADPFNSVQGLYLFNSDIPPPPDLSDAQFLLNGGLIESLVCGNPGGSELFVFPLVQDSIYVIFQYYEPDGITPVGPSFDAIVSPVGSTVTLPFIEDFDQEVQLGINYVAFIEFQDFGQSFDPIFNFAAFSPLPEVLISAEENEACQNADELALDIMPSIGTVPFVLDYLITLPDGSESSQSIDILNSIGNSISIPTSQFGTVSIAVEQVRSVSVVGGCETLINETYDFTILENVPLSFVGLPPSGGNEIICPGTTTTLPAQANGAISGSWTSGQPVGQGSYTFTATEGCFLPYTVNILEEDQEAPTFSCSTEPIVVELSADNPSVTLSSSNYLTDLFDNCDLNPAVNNPNKIITCADLAREFVEWIVEDENGNQDTCFVPIEVELAEGFNCCDASVQIMEGAEIPDAFCYNDFVVFNLSFSNADSLYYSLSSSSFSLAIDNNAATVAFALNEQVNIFSIDSVSSSTSNCVTVINESFNFDYLDAESIDCCKPGVISFEGDIQELEICTQGDSLALFLEGEIIPEGANGSGQQFGYGVQFESIGNGEITSTVIDLEESPISFQLNFGESEIELSPGLYTLKGFVTQSIDTVVFCEFSNGLSLLVNDCSLSSENFSHEDLWWNVFPNPSSNYFNIELSPKYQGQVRIAVYDLRGIEVSSEEITINGNENLRKIILEDPPSGVYMIRLSSQHSVSSKRLILQN